MPLNPFTFTGVKVEEDPQGFLDKIEKILSYVCHEYEGREVYRLLVESYGVPVV